MRDFEVHELVDGWVGQADTLEEAIAMRDDLLANHDIDTIEVKIMAVVDERDLARQVEAFLDEIEEKPQTLREVYEEAMADLNAVSGINDLMRGEPRLTINGDYE